MRLDQSEAHGCLWDHSPAFRNIREAEKLTPEKPHERIRAKVGSKSAKSTASYDLLVKFLPQQKQENDPTFYIFDSITNSFAGII